MASATSMINLDIDTSPNTWLNFSLAVIVSWIRSWLTSGAALESFLLLTGPEQHWSVSRYSLLAGLNTAYVLASTSWLFHLAFATLCWPLVAITCIVQYAAVSSFTRGRLRWLLNIAHFYRDKVAFFGLPSLVIDKDLDGMMTIRGVTLNMLDVSIELHGIEVGLDLGSGHELAIHCDAIMIKLFRQIQVDEVYGVHWFANDSTESESQEQRADSHTDAHVSDASSLHNKKAEVKDMLPSSEELSTERKRDIVKDRKDRILPGSEKDQQDRGVPGVHKAPPVNARLPSRNDVEAEQEYDKVLHELRTTNRLYQSRKRVEEARGYHEQPTRDSHDNRSALCADLRKNRPAMSPPSSRIAVSRLIDFFEPITRLLEKMPVVLRVLLWPLSQSHPISCPSICFTASGSYLGNTLKDNMFREHTTGDHRIAQLRDEVSSWLTETDLYIDFANLCGRGSVPLRTTDEITADLRSKDVNVSRISNTPDATDHVATLTGADASFLVPTGLLPSHGYLIPPPENKDDEDTAPAKFSIRGSLPANFSETFLSFLATLSKTSQMLDIEEEAGLAQSETSNSTSSDASCTKGDNEASHLHNFKEKLAHGRVGSALKHPATHIRQTLHKEVKKTRVDKLDGAWFAKWTHKLLRKLEGLDGDIGYSMEVPVGITRSGG